MLLYLSLWVLQPFSSLCEDGLPLRPSSLLLPAVPSLYFESVAVQRGRNSLSREGCNVGAQHRNGHGSRSNMG